MNNNQLTKSFWFANVWNFFPEFTVEDLEINYLKWSAYRKSFAKILQYAQLDQMLDPACLEILPTNLTGIVISFHYGPYRLIPHYLLATGYKISVLASSKIIQKERDAMQELLQLNELQQERLRYIDASRRTVLKNILSDLNENRLILVYLDADEGINRLAAKGKQSLFKAPVAAGKLYFHASIAQLAFRFHIPLSFLLMEKNEHNGRWKLALSKKLKCKRAEQSAVFMKRFERTLNSTINRIVMKEWTAWENWPLIHFYQPDLAQARIAWRNTPTWMIPICIQQRVFLFDIKSWRYYELKTADLP
ncbi:hypothetical protein [Sphingobacterium multivorum]|uniref:hypothetical protein n=1 Tax=Sphingobacterium multivorum TaxID=28454 RepID=UPI00289CB064|nr:hypothetical protein [Sphingobacterium multivorum]